MKQLFFLTEKSNDTRIFIFVVLHFLPPRHSDYRKNFLTTTMHRIQLNDDLRSMWPAGVDFSPVGSWYNEYW